MKTTRRRFLESLGGGVLALAGRPRGSPPRREAALERPPNFIIFFIDDLGYGDLGCYGAQGYETPRLDRMAAEGVRFTDFHVSQAVCSASRASLLTGCYSQRVGILGALGPAARTGISDREETIAQVLKKRGYVTGIIGKWHLGDNRRFLPLQHGFDEYLGLPYSNDMWPVGYDGAPLPKETAAKAYYPALPLIRNNEKIGEIRTMADQDKLTSMYTEAALDFIDRHKDQPFFLYLPHSMVHVPLGASGKFRGRSRRGLFGDVMMELDDSVGRVLDRLKERGLDERTAVFFAGDNGPWLNFGPHAGSAGPLREGKGTAWEGGTRVVGLARWPGRFPAGTECRKLATTMDILPTIAALAGAPLPSNRIDGLDIRGLLEGTPGADPRTELLYYYGKELRGVRRGRWKLVFPHVYGSYTGQTPGRNGLPGRMAPARTGLALYDLESDVGETTDVAAAHPDIVAGLQELAEAARGDLGDALTGREGRGCREPGRLPGPAPATVVHAAVGARVKVQPGIDLKYPGRGPGTLTNGRRGTLDFKDGEWLGFEGVDLEVIVDLGRVAPVRRIGAGFLRDQASWIFHPIRVDFALSADGKTVVEAGSMTGETRPEGLPAVRDFSAALRSTPARYVRVRAAGVKTCPDWHPGAGGKAWLFIDEVLVE